MHIQGRNGKVQEMVFDCAGAFSQEGIAAGSLMQALQVAESADDQRDRDLLPHGHGHHASPGSLPPPLPPADTQVNICSPENHHGPAFLTLWIFQSVRKHDAFTYVPHMTRCDQLHK